MKKFILLTITGLIMVNMFTFGTAIKDTENNMFKFVAEDEIYPCTINQG